MPERGQSKEYRGTWWKCILFLAAVIFSLVFLWASPRAAVTGEPGIQLPPRVIRFHVLAHSDDPRDQEIKDRVRREALMFLQPKLPPGATLEEVGALLIDEVGRLKGQLERLLGEWGVSQEVRVSFHFREFPTRAYGGQVYPAGVYPTYQVSLGSGQGQNWWCVMFPPLCLTELALVPAAAGEGEEERFSPKEQASPRFRFKIVEFFRKLMRKG